MSMSPTQPTVAAATAASAATDSISSGGCVSTSGIGRMGKAPAKVLVDRSDEAAADNSDSVPATSPPHESRPVLVQLRGTMTLKLDPRNGSRCTVRGEWSYQDESDRNLAGGEGSEGYTDKRKQTFELVRAPQRQLPRAKETGRELLEAMSGLYRGWFSFPAPGGGDRVIREKNAHLDFRMTEGDDCDRDHGQNGERYEVTGRGSNQFGRFVLRGRCVPDMHEDGIDGGSASVYRVEIEKEYLPHSPPKSPSPPRLRKERKRKAVYSPDVTSDEAGKTGRKKMTRRGCKKKTKKTRRETKKKKDEEDELVTREEFNGLVVKAEEMAKQMGKLCVLLGERASTDQTPVATGVHCAMTNCPNMSVEGVTKKTGKKIGVTKKAGKKISGSVSREIPLPVVAPVSSRIPRAKCPLTPDLVRERQELPLTRREKLDLVRAINDSEDEKMIQNVAQIIREGNCGGVCGADDDDAIELDLDQLNVATHRRLQTLVMKGKKRKRSSQRGCRRRKLTRKGTSPRKYSRDSSSISSLPPDKSQSAAETASTLTAGIELKVANATPRSVDPKPALSSFMAFGNREEEEDTVSGEEEKGGSTTRGEFEFTFAEERAMSNTSIEGHGLIDWSSLGAFAPKAADGASSFVRQGQASGGAARVRSNERTPDWEGAKRDAAKARSLGFDRAGRVDQAKADFSASQRRQAEEIVARGEETKRRRAEDEARQAARREEEEETRRRELREEVERGIGSVEQTVDLSPSMPLGMLQIPDSYVDILSSDLRVSASACSSPSSNFGF